MTLKSGRARRVRSLDLFMEYTPDAFLERIAPMPTGTTCVAPSCNWPLTSAHGEPKQLQLLSGNHYVAYDDGHAEAANAQAEFLLHHVAG